MSKRMAGYRAASKIKISLPIYKHFNPRNHNFESDITITILEKTTTDLLTNKENYWINTLETIYPCGPNGRYE